MDKSNLASMNLEERFAAAKAAAKAEAILAFEATRDPHLTLQPIQRTKLDAAGRDPKLTNDLSGGDKTPKSLRRHRLDTTLDPGGFEDADTGLHLLTTDQPKTASSTAEDWREANVENCKDLDFVLGQAKRQSTTEGQSRVSIFDSRGAPMTSIDRPCGKRSRDLENETSLEQRTRSHRLRSDSERRLTSHSDIQKKHGKVSEEPSKFSAFSLRPSRKASIKHSDSHVKRSEGTIAPATRAQPSRGDLQKLRYFKTVAGAYRASKDAGEPVPVVQKNLNHVRRYLHKMEFFDFLTPGLIRQANILEHDGLGHVVSDARGIYPPDVRDDACRLARRWRLARLETNILAGIITLPGDRQRNIPARRIHDRSYAFSATSHYVGSGMLVVGDWWPFQICCVRDGVHGEIEAGISGNNVNGAFSVVMSGSKYDDVDAGDRIEYSGTKGTAGQASAGTRQLLLSFTKSQPVRVFRSHSLPKENEYRPVKGIRYDGLYKITDFRIVDESTSMHRFILAREVGQTPIRYAGDERRPTWEEMVEYDKIRRYGT